MSTMNNSKEVIQYDDEEEEDDDDVSYDYTGKKDADNAAVVTPHCTSTSRSGSNIETGITTRASSATTKIVKLPRVYAEAVRDAVSAAESSSEPDFSAASSSCSPLLPPLVKDRLYQVIFYDEDNDDDDSIADCDILNQQTSNRDCLVDTSSLKYVGHKSPIEAIDIMYALVNHYASHVDGDAHDDNNDDDDDDDENNEPHGFYHMKRRCFEMFRKQIIYSLALARQRRDDDHGGQLAKCKYRIRQAYCKAQFVFCRMKLDLLRLASSVSTDSSSALTESAFATTSSADDVDDDDDDDDVAESTTTNLSRKVKRSKKRKRQSSTTSSSRSKRSIEEETVVDTDDEDIESEPSPTPQNKRIPNTDVSTTTTTTHHHRRQRKNDKEVWYTDSLIPRRCSRRHRHRRPRKFTSM